MKKKMMYVMALSGLMLGMNACDLADDGTNEIQELKNELTDLVQTSEWQISSFTDSGEDETSDFAGYTFTFGTDGTVNATNGLTTYEGTWTISRNSSDDDDDADLEFNLFFDVSEEDNFEDLNDDWDVLTFTTSTVALQDVSGGDGSIDALTFSAVVD